MNFLCKFVANVALAVLPENNEVSFVAKSVSFYTKKKQEIDGLKSEAQKIFQGIDLDRRCVDNIGQKAKSVVKSVLKPGHLDIRVAFEKSKEEILQPVPKEKRAGVETRMDKIYQAGIRLLDDFRKEVVTTNYSSNSAVVNLIDKNIDSFCDEVKAKSCH